MSLNIIKKILLKNKIFVRPGDSISLSYNDIEIMTSYVTESISVDTAIIFKIEEELGLEIGIGGILGKQKQNN